MFRTITTCVVAASIQLGMMAPAPASAQSDPSTFDTVINIGTGQADGTFLAGGNQQIMNTQVNLFSGGEIGSDFGVPWTLSSTVFVDPEVYTNNEVNIFGGVVNDNFELDGAGNRANMSGGTVGDMNVRGGAAFNMSGGTAGDITVLGNGSFHLSGGNVVGNVVGIRNVAPGTEEGVTFTMTGGTATGDWQFSLGAVFEMSGGTINGRVELFDTGGIMNFSGGVINAPSTTLSFEDAVMNFTGGTLNAAVNVTDSHVVITAGTIRDGGSFKNSTVDMSGGDLAGAFMRIQDGSTLNMSGGSLGLAFGVGADSTLNLSGGTIGDFFTAAAGSEINLFGTEFFLDGQAIDGLALNQASVLNTRGGAKLTGLLADGSSLDFDLFTGGSGRDIFSNTATLTLTLVPEPGTAAIFAFALPLLARRRMSR